MKTAEMIVKQLSNKGVNYVFGVPGGAIEDFNTALYHCPEIKVICAKHEEGAAYMADGYARISGNLGVCFATAGPGALHFVNPAASAFKDGIPVMYLTGQPPRNTLGKGAIQELLDAPAIFHPITKYSISLLSAERAEYQLQTALRRAFLLGSGPVHISMPVDIMRADISTETTGSSNFKTNIFDRSHIEEACQCLLKSTKPAIIAGYGVVLSHGAKELLALAEYLNIPVATTPEAKGVFPEKHILSLGVIGFAGTELAEQVIFEQEVDTLFVIGSSLGEMVTNGWAPQIKPTKNLIQVDINPDRIGVNYYVNIPVIGDAKTILTELLFALKRDTQTKNKPQRQPDFVTLGGNQEKLKNTSNEYHPVNLMWDLRKSLPEETIFFSEVGATMAWAIKYLEINQPYSWVLALGHASMGYATAAGIGGKIAAGDRPVIILTGDGSFLMNGTEVHTAVEYNIPVVWVILNDGGYGMVHHARQMFSPAIPEGIRSRFFRADFAQMANSLGAIGIKIQPGEITKELMITIIKEQKPTVLDVWIDPKVKPPIDGRIKTMQKNFQI